MNRLTELRFWSSVIVIIIIIISLQQPLLHWLQIQHGLWFLGHVDQPAYKSAFNWISLTLSKWVHSSARRWRVSEGGEHNLSESGNSESLKDADGSSAGYARHEVIQTKPYAISAELVMSVHECSEATPTGSRNMGWKGNNQWPNKPINRLVRYHNSIQLPSYSEQKIARGLSLTAKMWRTWTLTFSLSYYYHH